jgi:hypothetical protein
MPQDDQIQLSDDWRHAEFDFVREGLRQDQRERLAFMGFALAASGALLGILVRNPQHPPTSHQAFILIVFAFAVTIVTQILTIRATIGVASGGHYIREFIEAEVVGLRYQTRNRQFREQLEKGDTENESAGLLRRTALKIPRLILHSSVSSSSGLALAYGTLIAGLLAAWFVVGVSTHRSFEQGVAMTAVALVGGALSWQLWWTSHVGARQIGKAWEAIAASEHQAHGCGADDEMWPSHSMTRLR